MVVGKGEGAHSKFVSASQAEVEFVAMEGSRGKEGTSWEKVENMGMRNF